MSMIKIIVAIIVCSILSFAMFIGVMSIFMMMYEGFIRLLKFIAQKFKK